MEAAIRILLLELFDKREDGAAIAGRLVRLGSERDQFLRVLHARMRRARKRCERERATADGGDARLAKRRTHYAQLGIANRPEGHARIVWVLKHSHAPF